MPQYRNQEYYTSGLSSIGKVVMDKNQIVILADALVYLLTFIYWLIKLKGLNVGLIILAIMTMSHIGAVFYYTIQTELGVFYGDIQILPFIYLYLLIMLCLLPFLQYKGIKSVDIRGCETLATFFAIFIIILNIEPFLENLNLLRSSNAEYSELYEDMRNSELHIYTGSGKLLMRWCNYFRLLVPVLFFYYLSRPKVNKRFILGLGMCLANMVLYWINTGTRGGILSQFLMYTLTFVLFMPVMPSLTISKIKRYLLISAIPCIVIFAGITVSRYNSKDSDKSLIGWLLLYSSEGPIRFNTQMWNGPHNTNGDVNTNLIKDLLGMKTYTTYEERDTYYLSKNGRRIEVFYTFVGDFMSDFSYFGGILICFAFFIIERKLLRKNGIIPLHYFIFLLYFVHLYSIGFASNIYRSYGMQRGVLYMGIIYCIFAFSKKTFFISNKVNQMISVAMATYNGARYIREQIDSILSQTIQNFEIVICDDCSMDDTWDILEEYAASDSRFRIFRNSGNVGFKKNFEKAISLCTGEYIALCDQDDIWEPDHLEQLLTHVGDKMIACGDALMVDLDNQSMNMLLSYQESLDFVLDDDLKKAYSVYYFRSPYQGAGMLIRKKFFDVALPVPEGIAYHDAWFSLLACFYGGINFFRIPISRYRRHNNNVTGAKIERRPKLRTWFRHIRHQHSLHDRSYVTHQVKERCQGKLSEKQICFLNQVLRCFGRKKSIWGRILNSLFELSHYKLIFSCDNDICKWI